MGIKVGLSPQEEHVDNVQVAGPSTEGQSYTSSSLEASTAATPQPCHFLDLPAELWAYFAADVSAKVDLQATFSLVRTCKTLFDSSTGQLIRYLWGLHKHNCPAPRAVPRPLSTLRVEADRLFQTTWPPCEYLNQERKWTIAEGKTSGGTHSAFPSGLSGLDCTSLKIDGTHISGLSQDRHHWYHFFTKSSENGNQNVISLVASFWSSDPISEFDVDFDEGVAALMTAKTDYLAKEEQSTQEEASSMESSNITCDEDRLVEVSVRVVNIESGAESNPTPLDVRLCLAGQARLHVEVLGRNVLIRVDSHIAVYRWKSPISSMSSSRPPSPHWQLLWTRDSAASVFPVLAAHFFGLDMIVVLSRPTSSDHGLDWGSTLEFYRLTQSHSPRVADVQLPIRAKPVHGLSYVKTGLGKRLKSTQDDGLIVVCVEGFIWVADLQPFLDLLFPRNALSIFGAGHPTLDSHWVRAHMHKCSLASLDACPLRPVAVSGWRIAALWSRDYGPREAESNQEANAQLRGRRASHAVYIRFLQADPRFGQETSKITSRDCGPDMMDRPLLHTMFASHRFYSYCDHELTRYLGTLSPSSTFVGLDGTRMLLASSDEACLVFT